MLSISMTWNEGGDDSDDRRQEPAFCGLIPFYSVASGRCAMRGRGLSSREVLCLFLLMGSASKISFQLITTSSSRGRSIKNRILPIPLCVE